MGGMRAEGVDDGMNDTGSNDAAARRREVDGSSDVASPGYQGDSPGYQDREDDAIDVAGEPQERPSGWDPEVHIDPEEARERLGVTHGVPVAGPGLAGMAIERRTGKMLHVGGRVQWEVLAEPLLGPTADQQRWSNDAADRAAQDLAEDAEALREEVGRAPRGRRPWQVNVRLDDREREVVDSAARLCGVPRTTLARVLLLRGSEAILADSPD